jgi:hypothetical protein
MPSNGFAMAPWVSEPFESLPRCVTDSDSHFVYVLEALDYCEHATSVRVRHMTAHTEVRFSPGKRAALQARKML